jgi:hypothetical protein
LVLLKKLQQIPLFSELRLVGGTALALQLGHRNSIDLDFFGRLEIDHEILGFYTQKYSNGSVFRVLRSLCYFDDAEEQPMPKMFIPTEWSDIKNRIKESVRGLAN